jgi:talin
MVIALSSLESVNDGFVPQGNYSEFVIKIAETSKQVKGIVSGILTSAKAGNAIKLAQDLAQSANTLVNLTNVTVGAAYLIALSDPTSKPAVVSPIQQSDISQSGYDIKEACRKLVDPNNTQPMVLELAGAIAKHTSKLCNLVKSAGTNSQLSSQSKLTFITSAKDVASKTASVVANIKVLAVSLDEPSRAKTKLSCEPLLDAIDKLVQFSMSSEFAGESAVLSAHALGLQKPLIDANKSVISLFQDMISTSKLFCSNPKDASSIQLLSTESRSLSESLQYLVSVVTTASPGQRECEDALEKINESYTLVDAAIM